MQNNCGVETVIRHFYPCTTCCIDKETGIEVDLIVRTGIAERNSALKSGKLDALAAPLDYFVLSAGNGVSTTIVMAVDESVGGDGIAAKRSIQQFADLQRFCACLSKNTLRRDAAKIGAGPYFCYPRYSRSHPAGR